MVLIPIFALSEFLVLCCVNQNLLEATLKLVMTKFNYFTTILLSSPTLFLSKWSLKACKMCILLLGPWWKETESTQEDLCFLVQASINKSVITGKWSGTPYAVGSEWLSKNKCTSLATLLASPAATGYLLISLSLSISFSLCVCACMCVFERVKPKKEASCWERLRGFLSIDARQGLWS